MLIERRCIRLRLALEVPDWPARDVQMLVLEEQDCEDYEFACRGMCRRTADEERCLDFVF